jgi:hypothetical protein
MKWLSWRHSAMVIMVLGALAGCSKSSSPAVNAKDGLDGPNFGNFSTDNAKSADTPNAQSLVDLQNLREVGLLSSADYDAKLAALAKRPNTGTVYDAAMKEQPVESLKNLKNRGLVSDNEYQQLLPKADALERQNEDSNGNIIVQNGKVMTHRDDPQTDGSADQNAAANNSATAGEAAAAGAATVLIAGAAAANESKPSGQRVNGNSGSADNMRSAEIDDPTYQMRAGTVAIPASWKFAGEVVRPTGCHAGPTIIRFNTQSADNLFAVEMIPGLTWKWSSDPQKAGFMQRSGCAGIPVVSATDFLQSVALPELRPNAQIVSFDDGPAGTREQVATLQQRSQQQNINLARQYGVSVPTAITELKRVRIRYQLNGESVEEYIGVLVNCNERRFVGNTVAPPQVNRDCNSGAMVAYRAPAGQLESFYEQASNSIRLTVDPQWRGRLQGDQQAATDQAIAISQVQHANLMALSQEQERVRTRAWAAGEALRAGHVQNTLIQGQRDMTARKNEAQSVVHNVLGQGSFIDPQSGRRYLTPSNQYKYNYVAPDGTYYGTNDPLDPNRNPALPQGTYTPLQPTQ